MNAVSASPLPQTHPFLIHVLPDSVPKASTTGLEEKIGLRVPGKRVLGKRVLVKRVGKLVGKLGCLPAGGLEPSLALGDLGVGVLC